MGDGRKIEFPDNSFDCVVTHEFFTNVYPQDVENCAREMLRVSKRFFICIERFVFPGERQAPHTFSHDLTRLFREAGADILESRFVHPSMVGIVGEKKLE